MTAKHLRIFLWLLTVICFGYNFYVWGALKDTPDVGRQLAKEAPFGSPLAATYLFIGTKVNGTIGQTDEARDYVARKFPDLIGHPERVNSLGVFRFLNEIGLWGSFCYYMAPLLLGLSLVLHWMRQKKIRSLGSG